MKINKYFLGLAVILLGTLTSCETDVKGDVMYSPMGQNISFETAKPSTITTSQSSLTIPVRIIRSLTSGSYTANFTAEASEEGIFSISNGTSVTFAEGQGVVVMEVTASNLEKGKDYTYTLTLSPTDVATADTITKKQNVSTVISIHSDYTWVAAGTCSFTDFTFADDEENGETATKVPVENASGTNIYRIINPWVAVYNDKSAAGNLQFTLESDGTISFAEGTLATISGYDIYWNTSKYGDYCVIEKSGNKYTVSHLLVKGSNMYTGAFAFEYAR